MVEMFLLNFLRQFGFSQTIVSFTIHYAMHLIARIADALFAQHRIEFWGLWEHQMGVGMQHEQLEEEAALKSCVLFGVAVCGANVFMQYVTLSQASKSSSKHISIRRDSSGALLTIARAQREQEGASITITESAIWKRPLYAKSGPTAL